jgi:hypothetical protein
VLKQIVEPQMAQMDASRLFRFSSASICVICGFLFNSMKAGFPC